jgi:hypothetical protein
MDAHDLYGLPLDRFIPERTALAKALRTAGQRDEAATIAKLPKPSVAAWAANQLVRTQREAIAQLFEAGDALQRAHADVISGGGGARALREATERERAAVETLIEAARGLLSTEGHGLSPATLERVSETLHAGALDAGARDALSDGCLARELTRVGLGDGAFAGEPPKPQAGGPVEPPDADDAAVEEARLSEAAAREEEARRADAAARAEAAARDEARRAAVQAVRELEAAQERRDRAAAALEEAEAALTVADEALRAAEERAAEAARGLS